MIKKMKENLKHLMAKCQIDLTIEFLMNMVKVIIVKNILKINKNY